MNVTNSPPCVHLGQRQRPRGIERVKGKLTGVPNQRFGVLQPGGSTCFYASGEESAIHSSLGESCGFRRQYNPETVVENYAFVK